MNAEIGRFWANSLKSSLSRLIGFSKTIMQIDYKCYALSYFCKAVNCSKYCYIGKDNIFYTYMYVCVYIYIYIYMKHTHTYIHTYPVELV